MAWLLKKLTAEPHLREETVGVEATLAGVLVDA
jgi:hypothetical protein